MDCALLMLDLRAVFTPSDGDDRGDMCVRATNFDRHPERFATQAYRLQAFLIVQVTATDEDSDLKGEIDKLASSTSGLEALKLHCGR